MTTRRVFGMVTTSGTEEYTALALESFFEHTDFRDESDLFLLIDNDSSPGSLDLIKGYPWARLVGLDRPASYAANGNSVLRLANGLSADAYYLNNDVVFTPGWIEPLDVPAPAVMAPTGNQNHQYEEAGFELKPVMTAAEYRGREETFLKLVAGHRERHRGYEIAYKTNFFVVKVPPAVYRTVGLFDESFGAAGGEDDDYCVRTYLAGFSVRVAAESYLLHFGGRSTWGGKETPGEWRDREQRFIGRFVEKWGPYLTRFLIFKDRSVVENSPLFSRIEREGGIAKLFETMIAEGRGKAR